MEGTTSPVGRETESKIRDLIRQLRDVAEAHFAYSQVCSVLQNAFDHMAAIARVEEINQATEADAQEAKEENPKTEGR